MIDFRHPGTSEVVGAAAGAELALVTGRGPERLTNIGGSEPLVRDEESSPSASARTTPRRAT